MFVKVGGSNAVQADTIEYVREYEGVESIPADVKLLDFTGGKTPKCVIKTFQGTAILSFISAWTILKRLEKVKGEK